jgi:two-component system nitrogen regulation sensor histidine kinase GlnL
VTVDCTAAPLLERDPPTGLLLELRQVDWRLRINREENILAQHHTTRALVRNLAHEIKNPLGGLRGAAQLLERELPDPALREYTGIIIGEADRLRNLVDRMLGPNQLPIHSDVSIHEIMERVLRAGRGRSAARNPDRARLRSQHSAAMGRCRPPDPSDAQRGAQRSAGSGSTWHITLRSRVQRQYTIGAKRHKLVARLDIVDDGPGISPDQQEQIFYPMISGRPDGTGLGLSIAQNYRQPAWRLDRMRQPARRNRFHAVAALGKTG